VRAWRLVPLLLLLPACIGRPPVPRTTTPPDDSERVVKLAESEAVSGAHTEAVRLFEEVARDPTSPFVDRALIGLTRALCQPEYAGRDYGQAYVAADRLVHDYPQSPYASEGRAWRDLLAAYISAGDALEQRTRDLDQLIRIDMQRAREFERLKRSDAELERRTRELERRTQELERLKGLDLELEKRTRELERRTQELERLKRLDLELEQRQRKP
jgi:hypothetical protein